MDEQTSAIQAQINQVNQDITGIRRSVEKLAGIPAALESLSGQNKVIFNKLDEYQKTTTQLQIDLNGHIARCNQMHKNGNGPRGSGKKDDSSEVSVYQKVIKWIFIILIPSLIAFFSGRALTK